ncbi:MAG TPA: MerR family transcriptional regulator [Nitrospiraceae bacterium]|nr:MerR family transcriptional regulator [Nitrospiraceae bacterium]
MEPLTEKKAIPDKLFYKIGEVSRIAGVEPYILRYWETEFPFLKPRKNSAGQRVYIKKDLELVLQIKNLLYQEKYTIAGVRRKLGKTLSGKGLYSKELIERIKKRLREVLKNLEKPI